MTFLSILSIFYFFPLQGSLNVQIQNVKTTVGTIRLAIFDSEKNFLVDDKAIFAKEYSIAKKGEMQLTIPDLPFGKYAIAVYHDENGNQKLDKNLFGVPTEAYGFSNNFRSKWRAPKFSDGKIDFSSNEQAITIGLQKWKNQ